MERAAGRRGWISSKYFSLGKREECETQRFSLNFSPSFSRHIIIRTYFFFLYIDVDIPFSFFFPFCNLMFIQINSNVNVRASSVC